MDTNDADEIPRMDIAEFQAEGFLQEANRNFFHPLGLALGIEQTDEGSWRLGGIWDYRDDPEGMVFADLAEHEAIVKAGSVAAEAAKHTVRRLELFGSVIQPVGTKFPRTQD